MKKYIELFRNSKLFKYLIIFFKVYFILLCFSLILNIIGFPLKKNVALFNLIELGSFSYTLIICLLNFGLGFLFCLLLVLKFNSEKEKIIEFFEKNETIFMVFVFFYAFLLLSIFWFFYFKVLFLLANENNFLLDLNGDVIKGLGYLSILHYILMFYIIILIYFIMFIILKFDDIKIVKLNVFVGMLLWALIIGLGQFIISNT